MLKIVQLKSNLNPQVELDNSRRNQDKLTCSVAFDEIITQLSCNILHHSDNIWDFLSVFLPSFLPSGFRICKSVNLKRKLVDK